MKSPESGRSVPEARASGISAAPPAASPAFNRSRRGADRERRVQHLLEGLGWIAKRSSGSRGTAAVVAWSPEGICWFIQVKGRGHGVYGAEREAWFAECRQAGAYPVLVRPDRLGRLHWQIWRVRAGRWLTVHPAAWHEGAER